MKKLLLGLIVLFTIVSCKKNESGFAKSEPNFKLSKSGYIQFKDLASFKVTLESLKQMSEQEL